MRAVHSRYGKWTGMACLAAALTPSSGCIVAGAGLAVKVVGDAIHDADAKDKAAQLEGKAPEAADGLFGPRVETLDDLDVPARSLIVYPVPGQKDVNIRYTVEVRHEKIAVVSKNKFGTDKRADEKLMKDIGGKNPAQCESIADLHSPVLKLWSIERKQLVRVYDRSSIIKGKRYLVLRFDEKDRCVEADVVRPQGTSQKGGIIKGGG